MDVAVYLRVIRRFWILLVAGVVVAVALAGLIHSRSEPPEYISASTLFVTQEGFPWGRAILDEVIEVQVGDEESFVPRYGDPGRYSGLAQLYAALAQSDEVRNEVLQGAPTGARYEPEVVRSSDNAGALPLIYMKGFASSAEDAEAMANRAADAFVGYLTEQQVAADIPPEKRVEVLITSRATPAEVFEGRSLARPMVVLLAVLAGVVGLAFLLDNIRPHREPLRAEKQAPLRSAGR